MNQKPKTFLYFTLGALLGVLVMYLFSNYKIEKKYPEVAVATTGVTTPSSENPRYEAPETPKYQDQNREKRNSHSSDIDELTREDVVIDYVKKNHRLPDYYITKSEARNQGWIASKENLCDVLPGRAIGGDRFSNREKQLPQGPQYYEADVNYNCGRRNADRIVFTKDGKVYLTKNHYKTFEKQ